MNLLKQYALSFLGLPYRWGGSNTIDGFDCSGLVQEILASVGMAPEHDLTAHGLYHHFLERGQIINQIKFGALIFYGNEKKISHVAFCLDNFRILEAGGGNSQSTTHEKAAKQNAFVRIRKWDNRNDLFCVIMPDYSIYF